METLTQYRDAMDASPLLLKDRIEAHFERARYHFPSLKRHLEYGANNLDAFLGTRELAVSRAFSMRSAVTVRARLKPEGIWIVRATGKGLDVFILCLSAFSAWDYLQTRGPIKELRYTAAYHAYKPNDVAENSEFVCLPEAEPYLKANDWLKKQFGG